MGSQNELSADRFGEIRVCNGRQACHSREDTGRFSGNRERMRDQALSEVDGDTLLPRPIQSVNGRSLTRSAGSWLSGWRSARHRRAHQRQNFPVLRVSPKRLLRKHQVAVDDHLEYAAARRHQRHLANVGSMLSQDLFRRTDGFREIVSLAAVFDRNPGAASHGALPRIAGRLLQRSYCGMGSGGPRNYTLLTHSRPEPLSAG